ncbi:MAG: hypothetical protein ACI4U3_02215 [Traorella sp.]
MKLIDIIIILIIAYITYLAIKTYLKQGNCGCGKKNCPNRKRAVTKNS